MRESVRTRVGAAAIVVSALVAWSLPGAVSAQDETLPELMRVGETVYRDNCAVCHGDKGQGTGNAPGLDGNSNVESRTLVINQVLWGDSDHGMPAFVDSLDDRQIAAVATYIRNSWKNDYGVVYPRSVELRR